MDSLSFFVGFGVGILACIIFYVEKNKEVNENTGDTEILEMDYQNEFYVKLPDNPEIRRIMIEEPLDLNHRVNLDGTTYKVVAVDHKENGHTIYALTWTHL